MKTKTDIKLDRDLKRSMIEKRNAETELIKSKMPFAPQTQLRELQHSYDMCCIELKRLMDKNAKLRGENFTLNAENHDLKFQNRKMKIQQRAVLGVAAVFATLATLAFIDCCYL